VAATGVPAVRAVGTPVLPEPVSSEPGTSVSPGRRTMSLSTGIGVSVRAAVAESVWTVARIVSMSAVRDAQIVTATRPSLPVVALTVWTDPTVAT
jgi:hypothetical protein